MKGCTLMNALRWALLAVALSVGCAPAPRGDVELSRDGAEVEVTEVAPPSDGAEVEVTEVAPPSDGAEVEADEELHPLDDTEFARDAEPPAPDDGTSPGPDADVEPRADTSSELDLGEDTHSPLTLSLGSLSAAASGSSRDGSTMKSPEAGASPNAPKFDGLRLAVQFNIELFTGTYGSTEETRAAVFSFESPFEVELSNEPDSVIDLATVGTPVMPPAGTYTHAGLAMLETYAIKAHFQDGDRTVYTTAAGLQSTDGPLPGADYDYQTFDTPLYGGTGGAFETTFFETPLVHDGVSPLALNVLLDINRFGYFTSAGTDARFIPSPPNIYVTFNALSAPVVETYALAPSALDVERDTVRTLTLVFSEDGALVGGRTRGLQGNFIFPQFLRQWSCDPNAEVPGCTFLAGDYASHPDGQFPYTGEGFVRTGLGDEARAFMFTDTAAMTTYPVHYRRLER